MSRKKIISAGLVGLIAFVSVIAWGAENEIQATFINEDPQLQPMAVSIDERTTARGMIGKILYNEAHEKVAAVHDIILDTDGVARMIVVGGGKFPGVKGNLAALDYDAVVDRAKEGDLVTSVTPKSIEDAADFTYGTAPGATIKSIPENGYSVRKLLEGKLLTSEGGVVANIDNVSFRDGRAALVIASYHQVFNVGGARVAVDFNAASVARNGEEINLRLSPGQTAKFRDLTRTAGDGKKELVYLSGAARGR